MAVCRPHVNVTRNYDEIGLISSGTYGKVVKVIVVSDFNNSKYNLNKGMVLAMKVAVDNKGERFGEIKEIDILNRVNHPNVINAYDTFSESESGVCVGVNLVLPLAEYTLNDYIENERSETETTVNIMYQLLCGLAYLHSNAIIHDDVKPNNILIYKDDNTGDLIAKFADFGLSGNVINPDGIVKSSQSLYWRPYELFHEYIENGTRKNLHSYESDIWALGVVFYELITGNIPFKPQGKSEDGDKDESDSFEFEKTMIGLIDEFMSNDKWKSENDFQGKLTGSANLIGRMLDTNPKTRSSAEDLLNDVFFMGRYCLHQQIEPLDCNKNSFISVNNRKMILNWMNELRERDGGGYFELFLAIDIFDRYLAKLTLMGKEYHVKTSKYQLVTIVSIYLADEVHSAPSYSILRLLAITSFQYEKEEFMNMMCDILEKLNWVVFQPTLYVKHPELDPEKLFKCYLETPSPTLEMCERIP